MEEILEYCEKQKVYHKSILDKYSNKRIKNSIYLSSYAKYHTFCDIISKIKEAINFTDSSSQLKKGNIIDFEEWKTRFVEETDTNNVYRLRGDCVIGEDLITEYEQDVLLYKSLIV